MHIGDLKRFSLLWLHKTEEVRADVSHWSKNITGDIYEAGWISEMYGYSFAAAEVIYQYFHPLFKSGFRFSHHLTLPLIFVFHHAVEFAACNKRQDIDIPWICSCARCGL